MTFQPDSASIGVMSRGMLRIPFLAEMAAAQVRPVTWISASNGLSAVAGWGCRPTTRKALAYAKRHSLPYWALEDGFLRSYGTGDRFPPLSIVVDAVGIYYDSTRPSALENLLQSDADVLAGHEALAAEARARILRHGLSKYNHASPLAELEAALGQPLLRPEDRERVLVVDQTAGDLSIALGGASAATFEAMLQAALTEHRQATVYVKTHPEVTAGRKGGHFAHLQNSERVVVLRQAIEPLSLLQRMDAVYVATSTMGFEALLAGKPVNCFGAPWYAGWGATQDRLPRSQFPRRTRPRTVSELFAAAYLHYARYLNPITHQRGAILDVIDWLVRQRQMARSLPTSQGS